MNPACRRGWSHRLGGSLLAVVVGVALLTASGSSASGSSASASSASPGAALVVTGQGIPQAVDRVLILSLPRLRWADVAAAQPPALVGLLARSAVASMSVRTLGAETSAGEGYATIGAGNRATVEEEVAGLAFPVDAGTGEGPAGTVFERDCACDVAGASVVHLGTAEIDARNRRLLYGAEVGSLGAALAKAGRTVAVVGNADGSLDGQPSQDGDAGLHREAALAVVDREGRVPAGAVGAQLSMKDPSAPFGVRTDVDATVAAFNAAWDQSDVVLLEASDLERVDRWAAERSGREAGVGPDKVSAERAAALDGADRLLAKVLPLVDLRRDLVVVVSPDEPRGGPTELTVGAIAGPGFRPGLARSGTTRRDGFVTLPDLAPTVLRAFGVPLPSAVNGAPITSGGGAGSGPAGFSTLSRRLAEDSRVAVFRNQVAGPVTVAFIVTQVLTYALAALILTSARRRARLRLPVMVLALMGTAGPTVAFLSGLVSYRHLGLAGYLVAFFAASAALAMAAVGVAIWAQRRGGPRLARAGTLAAPLVLAGLLLAVLVVDIVTGAKLQLNTVFGYSPIVAGRFSGYGNLASGLVAMSAIVVAAGAWGATQPRVRPSPAGRRRSLAAVATLFALTVAALGLPRYGADVGGVLSVVPAFLVTVLLLRGVTLTVRRLGLVALVTVGVIAVFGAADLARPAEARTHLGRFLAVAADEGASGVVPIIERKMSANLLILTSSVWTLFIPVVLAFLVFLVWRRAGFLERLEERMPGSRACLVGALVVAVLGALLNDSGVAIPGIMFAVLLPYLTILTLAINDDPCPPRC
ncbi:MAG: hypothetical protein ACR2G7_08505 [Acidimicrobiales bacterium]